jgi:site-specific recombinase XerD
MGALLGVQREWRFCRPMLREALDGGQASIEWEAVQGSGTMVRARQGSPYPYLRDESDFVGSAIFPRPAQRATYSVYHRQYNLQAYAAGGFSTSRPPGFGQRHSASGYGTGRNTGGRDMDSVRTERDTRQSLPLGGRQRLGGDGWNVGKDSQAMGKSEHRPLLFGPAKLKAPKVQHQVRKPRVSGIQLHGARLVPGGPIIRMPTNGNGGRRASADSPAEGRGSDRRPSLAPATVVAQAPTYGIGQYLSRKGHRRLPARPVGPMRPAQEPSVGVSRSQSERKRKLSEQISVADAGTILQMKKRYVDTALEPQTLATYKSLVKQYESFCLQTKATPWPAQMEVVENCTTWIMYSGKPSSAGNLWSAINSFQVQKGFPPLTKSNVLRTLHVKALKMAAQTAKPLRDPIPIEAIVAFCNTGSKSNASFAAKAAIVTVGCRALLRYKEMANLKIKDVSFINRQLKIELGTRKNRKQRAAPLHIDPSLNNSNSCPVVWMRRHLDFRLAQGAKPDDFVFTSKFGKIISYNTITEILQQVLKCGPYSHLVVSSHSMRITGAVMMMMAGFDNLKIQIIVMIDD